MIAKKIIQVAQTGIKDAAQISTLAIKELEIRPPQLAACHISSWNVRLEDI